MTRNPRTRPTGAAVIVGAMIGAVAIAGCGAGQITQTSRQVTAVNGAGGNAGSIAVRDVSIAFPDDVEGADIYPSGGDAPLQMSIINAGQAPDRLVSASSPAAASVRISGDAEVGAGQVVVVEGEPPAPAPTTASTPALAPTGPAAPGGVTPTTGATPSGASSVPVPSTVAPTGPPSPGAPGPSLSAVPTGSFDPAGPGQGSVQNPSAVDEGAQVVLTGLRDDVRAGLTYPLVLTFEKAGDIRIDVPVANSTATREAEPEG